MKFTPYNFSQKYTKHFKGLDFLHKRLPEVCVTDLKDKTHGWKGEMARRFRKIKPSVGKDRYLQYLLMISLVRTVAAASRVKSHLE